MTPHIIDGKQVWSDSL